MKAKTRTAKSEVFGFNKAFVSLIFILEVMLVFTFFDYAIHSSNPEYAVPVWYFQNKIIYGTIIGFITYLFIRKRPVIQKSLILSAVISVLLQIRYYIYGYPMQFVLLFLAIHFIILFLVAWAGFKITKV